MLSVTLVVVVVLALILGCIAMVRQYKGTYQWGLSVVMLLAAWGIGCFALPAVIAWEGSDSVPGWLMKISPYLGGMFRWLYLIGIGVLLYIGNKIAAGTDYDIDWYGRATPRRAEDTNAGITEYIPTEQVGLSWTLLVVCWLLFIGGGLGLVGSIVQLVNSPRGDLEKAFAELHLEAKKSPAHFSVRMDRKEFSIMMPKKFWDKKRVTKWQEDIKAFRDSQGDDSYELKDDPIVTALVSVNFESRSMEVMPQYHLMDPASKKDVGTWVAAFSSPIEEADLITWANDQRKVLEMIRMATSPGSGGGAVSIGSTNLPPVNLPPAFGKQQQIAPPKKGI